MAPSETVRTLPCRLYMHLNVVSFGSCTNLASDLPWSFYFTSYGSYLGVWYQTQSLLRNLAVKIWTFLCPIFWQSRPSFVNVWRKNRPIWAWTDDMGIMACRIASKRDMKIMMAKKPRIRVTRSEKIRSIHPDSRQRLVFLSSLGIYLNFFSYPILQCQ